MGNRQRLDVGIHLRAMLPRYPIHHFVDDPFRQFELSEHPSHLQMTAFYCGSHLPREHGSLTHNCSKSAMPGCSYTTMCSCNAPPLCLDCSLQRTPIHQHNSAQHTMIKSSADANSLKSPFPVTCSSLCVIPAAKEDRLHYTSGIVARHSRKRDKTKWMGFHSFLHKSWSSPP